jgi:hypothetical integral membrane protein (TIGR02206 family)
MCEPEVTFMSESSRFIVVVVMVMLPAALALVVRSIGGARLASGGAYSFAALLIANKAVGLSLVYHDGVLSWREILPMHLCDWSLIATLFALITRAQLAYELSYFWGLSGGVQAILTPDIRVGFDDIHAWVFFISHAGSIAAVLYLTLAIPMRPYERSMWRAFVWSQFYLVAASATNLLLGTNYGYLCAKASQPSLLDYLGPWPYYILSMEALTVLSFLFYYLPFYAWDKWRARRCATLTGI